jgi:DNA-binding IclR family transcriptional regulator
MSTDPDLPAAIPDDDSDNEDRGGVQSVEIAALVLKALATEGGALPLKRLAAVTEMPRAKVHRYLVSLKRAGLVAQDAASGHYRIGAAAITIGLAGLQSLNPVRTIVEALPVLRDRIDETVTCAIWSDNGPVLIAMEESSHVVTMNVRVGSVLPLLTSAIGNVFAAYLPDAVTRKLIESERQRGRDAMPSPAEFTAALEDIRNRQIARVQNALLPGVNAFAAPVFDHQGKIQAALCVVGRSEALEMGWEGTTATRLRDAARDISQQLGYVPPRSLTF